VMALAGELANTLVTRNSRATRTSKYLAPQLRVTGKSVRSRVQTPEYEFIVTREFKLSSTNLSRGLFSYVTPSIVDCEWSSHECESRTSATLHLSGTVVRLQSPVVHFDQCTFITSRLQSNLSYLYRKHLSERLALKSRNFTNLNRPVQIEGMCYTERMIASFFIYAVAA